MAEKKYSSALWLVNQKKILKIFFTRYAYLLSKGERI